MTLGPFLFMAPLTLLGLIALPVIWYILRATPPTPKQAQLPSLRLLEDVEPKEETPSRTPWWVLLLRLGAAALAILGLAMPIYAPGTQNGQDASGPVLVIVDDGWTSASRWSEVRAAALSALDGESRDTPAHVLLTAPRTIAADPAERLDRSAFEARIRSLQPQAWAVDRAAALERLEDSRLRPGRILWLTDGLDPESAGPFAQALIAKAPLSIYATRARGPIALTRLSSDAGACFEIEIRGRQGSAIKGQRRNEMTGGVGAVCSCRADADAAGIGAEAGEGDGSARTSRPRRPLQSFRFGADP